METIRIYLENMFINLPGTPQVYKAKEELLSMMEDKYLELKAEGKTENEAIGIVISEFGNLEEIASDLGLDKIINNENTNSALKLTLEEVKSYLSDYARHAMLISVGVMLCILSVCGPIFTDAYVSAENVNDNFFDFDVIGASVLFVFVAIAVGCFVFSSISIGKWKKLEKNQYMIDFSTSEYVNNIWEKEKLGYAFKMTLGVVLCVLSVVPSIIASAVSYDYGVLDDISGGLLFIFVAIGVCLIVQANIRRGSLNRMLNLNDRNLVGGNYTTGQKEKVHYSNKNVEAVMSVFWPTVTCIYLCISFLTFSWGITWIIWPIAGIIHSLIKNTMGEGR